MMRVTDDADIAMRRSMRPSGDDDVVPDIWRICWAWQQGAMSASTVELYETRESFERALFGLLVEQEANHHDGRPNLWFHVWRKLFRARRQGEPPPQVVKRILSVEHLEDGQWVPYRFGAIAPSVAYVRQED